MIAIPSNNLTATPSVLNNASDNLNVALDITGTYSGNLILTENPARMMFLATGPDTNIHLYGIDLTSASAPVPVQISNLSLTNINQYCAADTVYAEDNLKTPSSLWAVIHYSSGTPCTSGNGSFVVINYTDSSSTAPATVGLTSTSGFTAMYHSPSGALAGLVLPQGTSLNFYASKTFTGPTALVQNINSASELVDTSSNGQDMLGESVEFYVVTNNAGSQLYRITTTPTATSIYTFQGTDWVSSPRNDATNVYFADTDATSYRILHAPIASGNAALNYTADNTAGTYSLLGSNGTLFAYLLNATGGTATVNTIQAGTASSPTTIATYNNLSGSAFLAESTYGTISSARILVNLTVTPLGTKSSDNINFSGSSLGVTPNSEFEVASTLFGTNVFQVRGITDTTPVLDGGGTLNVYGVSTATATALTLSGGASYTIPTANIAVAGGIGGSPTDIIGFGIVSSGGSTSTGLAIDSASHLIVPITYASSTVQPF